jgi:hypothetical protein
LEKAILRTALEKAFFRKVTRVKRCSAQKPVDQLFDIRSDGANRWQTQQKTETTIEMTARGAKPSQAWAELSPPQRKER